MSFRTSRIDRLKREIARDAVVPERYSRSSILHRSVPVLVLISFALIAILGSPLLYEVTRAPEVR